MPAMNRRDVLTGSSLALTAAAAPSGERAGLESVAADLDRYVGFGPKSSGGPGDTACGSWLADTLGRTGYSVERQPFKVPWFEASCAELKVGKFVATVIPQAIVVPTLAGGVTGPLVRIDPVTGPSGPLPAAIALLDLPYARWSSAASPPIHTPVTAALAAGAVAVIIVTNGPTGGAIALNADGNHPTFSGPVAILAPNRAKPFLMAAAKGGSASLTVEGRGGRRPAFNLIGRMDRKRDRWIVVSTPRSGWFTCAGERGPGLAAWLALARWASDAMRNHNLAFICNSGHEYEYLGSERAIEAAAPPPERTAFWLHLGANVAARDWHETGSGLLPLPSADPQRFLMVSPSSRSRALAAFEGLPGLEAAYPASAGAAGELATILAAGYTNVAGIFGGHHFHHSPEDDRRCVSAALVGPVITACRQLLRSI